MAFAQAYSTARPIAGAVATLGVSDRVAFLRKTYAHLGFALLAFAAITGGMMRYMTPTSLRMSSWAFTGSLGGMFIALGLFMFAGYIARRLASSETSRGLQYLGLLIGILSYSFFLQPVLWELIVVFGTTHRVPLGDEGFVTGQAASILTQSIILTLTIFVGLTISVFISKKDFSFLRGVLTIGTFAALGIILASWLFGFNLGALFFGAVIVLLAGSILYQTTLLMNYFPPQGYVAASLMLFSTVATLFLYVLRLLMELNRR